MPINSNIHYNDIFVFKHIRLIFQQLYMEKFRPNTYSMGEALTRPPNLVINVQLIIINISRLVICYKNGQRAKYFENCICPLY